MRAALLWASTNPLLARRLPRYAFVKRATRRFMPGETLPDALRAAGGLAEKGLQATVTRLGENLASPGEADDVLEHYLGAFELVRSSRLDVEISVKPTQLGLDYSSEDAQNRLASLVEAAAPAPVWLDMESSGYVDATLALFRGIRERNENIGICLQAYLRRTADDLRALAPLEPSIRIVKGAYLEPSSVAFPDRSEVDSNFLRLTRTLLEARAEGGSGRPVVASHDPDMLEGSLRMAASLDLAPGDFEIAMLFGIARRRQVRLAGEGHRVRVLISYGPEWFPWYMRRLAERPANLWFVAKQMLR